MPTQDRDERAQQSEEGPPTSAPMTTSDPGTEIVRFMIRGVST